MSLFFWPFLTNPTAPHDNVLLILRTRDYVMIWDGVMPLIKQNIMVLKASLFEETHFFIISPDIILL